MTKTSAADIGIHTVNYSVEITDYKEYTTAITGNFTFEIKKESFVAESFIEQEIAA